MFTPKNSHQCPAQDGRSDKEAWIFGSGWWSSALRETIATARLYESIDLGLTDASLVALAAHLETTRIATLDERHFRAVQPLTTGATSFTLLPGDEPTPV
jgi:hypothetical protein